MKSQIGQGRETTAPFLTVCASCYACICECDCRTEMHSAYAKLHGTNRSSEQQLTHPTHQQRSASPRDLRVGSSRHRFQLAAAISTLALTLVLPMKLLTTCTKIGVVCISCPQSALFYCKKYNQQADTKSGRKKAGVQVWASSLTETMSRAYDKSDSRSVHACEQPTDGGLWACLLVFRGFQHVQGLDKCRQVRGYVGSAIHVTLF